MKDSERQRAQQQLIDGLMEREQVVDFVLWYYTPMALGFHAPLVAPCHRLRLHGRAVGVQGRAAAVAADRKQS